MIRLVPFTTLLTSNFGNHGRILPGVRGFASFDAANVRCEDRGWLPRIAGADLAGLDISGQSYDGGTTT